MFRLLLFFLCMIVPLTAAAQDYAARWKRVDDFSAKDLPKSALAEVDAIRKKAEAEGQTAQLIRALCTRHVMLTEISPDSSASALAPIEAALAAETRPVERALWQHVLGRSLTEQNGSRTATPDTANLTRGRRLLLESLTPIAELGRTSATRYAPLFKQGQDSRLIYNDDLLSLLTHSFIEVVNNQMPSFLSKEQVKAVLQRNLDYYRTEHRRRAALATELLMAGRIKGGKEQCTLLDDIRLRYLDLADNAETYLRLCEALAYDGQTVEPSKAQRLDRAVALAQEGIQRYGGAAKVPALANFLANEEQPKLNLHWHDPLIPDAGTALYPGAKMVLRMNYNHLREVELRFHRIAKPEALVQQAGRQGVYPHDLKPYLTAGRSTLVKTFRKTLPPDLPHRERRDSIEFTVPESGAYVVELLADGTHKFLAFASVARAHRLRFEAESKADPVRRDRVVDALDGRALAPEESDDRYLPTWDNRTSRYGRARDRRLEDSDIGELDSRLYTDRAIYRPGQSVEASVVVWIRRPHSDAVHAVSSKAIAFILHDSEGNALDTLHTTTDAFGTASARFTLPKAVRPGRFLLQAEGAYTKAYHGFRVEEYRRPTFTVTLDTLRATDHTGRPLPGDRVVLRGHVRTVADLPVPEARVVCSVEGTRGWWWRNEGEQFHTSDTLTTDAQGNFTLTFTLMSLQAEEAAAKRMPSYCFRYTLTAEALASNGETQRAERTAFIAHGDAPENREEPAPLETLRSTREDEAAIAVRRPCHLHYDVVSTDGGLVESRTIEVKDSTTFTLRWEERFGDAATLFLAFVEGGELHWTSATATRPRPDQRLVMRWATFRDRLEPGQTEQWTLSLTHPDGTPAEANVMARLYDLSLDAFEQSPWNFSLNFPRLQPEGRWEHRSMFRPTLFTTFKEVKRLPEPDRKFSEWHSSLFTYYGLRIRGSHFGALRMPVMLKAKANFGEEAIALASINYDAPLSEEKAGAAAPGMGATGTQPSIAVRSDFRETAFFFPQLRTDSRGVATLRFTLPESLTSWRFDALATDRTLRYALLSDTVVARKLLSVELAKLRFLREGDTTLPTATLRNLSERPQHVRLSLSLTDAATGHSLHTEQKEMDLAVDEVHAAGFGTFTVPDGVKSIVARIEAVNTDKDTPYSDGESWEIPILPRRVQLTHAIPFTVKGDEHYNTKLAAARQRLLAELEHGVQPILTIDTCRDARTEVAKTLPELLKGGLDSPLDCAIALYGVELAATLPHPVAWDTETLALRRAEAADRLRTMQRGNGGWSWWPGMESSPWITAHIAQLLARQQTLAKATSGTQLLDRAFAFLDQVAAGDVAEMKRMKRDYISDTHCRYLYASVLTERKLTAAGRYLRELMARERKSLTMYGKSGMAVILAGTTHDAEARLALESLVEHTVETPEMGRYFDTRRAFSGWSSYRIPTQTFAIEALDRVADPSAPVAGVTVPNLIGQMKLWLLQSKRTQEWRTSLATTDALFTLLHQPDAANAGLTWGAISATYALPYSEVVQKGNGFKLDRRMEVLREGQWSPVATGKQGEALVQIGQHVRWVYTLTAERDFDHVSLRSCRPSCCEPLRPLSGYDSSGGLWAYRMVRDAEQEYFIEHLPKGQHTFTDELVVSAAGRYEAGLAKVHSVFAPEFSAHSTPLSVQAGQ